MNYTRRSGSEWVKVRLENQVSEGQEILKVTSLPNLEDIEAYQEKICKWRDATYDLLQSVYEAPEVVPTHCHPIEKLDLMVEMRNEARDKLKAQVSKIVAGIEDLLSKWD